jgi:hypothetical protein
MWGVVEEAANWPAMTPFSASLVLHSALDLEPVLSGRQFPVRLFSVSCDHRQVHHLAAFSNQTTLDDKTIFTKGTTLEVCIAAHQKQ